MIVCSPPDFSPASGDPLHLGWTFSQADVPSAPVLAGVGFGRERVAEGVGWGEGGGVTRGLVVLNGSVLGTVHACRKD